MDGTTGLSWMAWTWPTAAFFAFILLGPGRHVGMGMVFARRASAARHSRLGYDARRPALHFAARQRIHTPGLARDHGHSPVGRTCPLAHLRRGGVPLGLTKTRCGQRSSVTAPTLPSAARQAPPLFGECNCDFRDARRSSARQSDRCKSFTFCLGMRFPRWGVGRAQGFSRGGTDEANS